MLCDGTPLPDDVATLQALVAGLSAQLAVHDANYDDRLTTIGMTG